MAEPIKITLGSLDGSIKTVKVMNKLAASAVTSVAGRVGDVVLSQYDVGLGNLNNTSDLNKPISIATQNALDDILLSGANVNADWNAVGGPSEIFNKPVFGDITGSSTADFATSDQGVLADSAIQSISSNTGVLIDNSDPVNIVIDVTGAIGPSGEQGPIGPQGPQGEIGPSGAQGIQGEIGPSGLQGPQGEIGPSGLQGLQGEIGPSGEQGLQGEIGPSGAIGLTGPAGADAVVDNTAYGVSWSGDITQAATRDALYNEIEILPRFGDNVSDFNNDALYTSSGDNVSLFANDVGYVTGDYQLLNERGVAGGYASLDGGGKVPSSELPSYVDDVLEYSDFASLPVTGETGKIYVTIDDGKIYRWTGSVYVEISADAGAPVLSVNTLIGAVVLDPDDLDDSLTTNKFTSQTEIDKLSGIAPNAEVNVNADWTSVDGDSEILNKPIFGDITGSNIADFATSGQGLLADSALQNGDNISELVNDVGYLNSVVASDIDTSNVFSSRILTSNFGGVASWEPYPTYVLPNLYYNAVAVDTTILPTEDVIDATSADITITLPTAVGKEGKTYTVKNSSAGVITISPSGAETIDGESSIDTNSKTALTLLSTNSNWIII